MCSAISPHRHVEARGIVEGRGPQHREAQRVEHVGAEAVVADRQRADRVAVVGAAEREERRAPGRAAVVPVLERDLERLLDRRRAVARVEEVRVVDGHDARQRLRELDHDPVAVAEHRRVRAQRELADDRVVELGHVMAERGDPQRRDRVEVALAVDVDQLVALGAVDDDRVVVGERRHLREAVPYDLRVAFAPTRRAPSQLDSDAQWWAYDRRRAIRVTRSAARPPARGDLPLRGAVRDGQDDDRRHRQGVGRLPGDDLPPVRRRPRRAAARDGRLGARQLLQPARRPGARRPEPGRALAAGSDVRPPLGRRARRAAQDHGRPSPSGSCRC